MMTLPSTIATASDGTGAAHVIGPACSDGGAAAAPAAPGGTRAPVTPRPAACVVGSGTWRAGLPALHGARLTLRELRSEDAPALFMLLTTEEVARFITPPPTSVAGFERFIAWAQQRRAEGRYACFAVVPHGAATAVGLFQIHLHEADRGQTAEWGFALGSPYWGTGLFLDGARLVVDLAFETLGVRRLEARATVQNGRGNGALRKIGAVKEGVLRQSFERHGTIYDQALWTILRAEWWSGAPAPVTGGILQ